MRIHALFTFLTTLYWTFLRFKQVFPSTPPSVLFSFFCRRERKGGHTLYLDSSVLRWGILMINLNNQDFFSITYCKAGLFSYLIICITGSIDRHSATHFHWKAMFLPKSAFNTPLRIIIILLLHLRALSCCQWRALILHCAPRLTIETTGQGVPAGRPPRPIFNSLLTSRLADLAMQL